MALNPNDIKWDATPQIDASTVKWDEAPAAPQLTVQEKFAKGLTDERGIPYDIPPEKVLALRDQQRMENERQAYREKNAGVLNKIGGALEVPLAIGTGLYGSTYGAIKSALGQADVPFQESMAKEGQRFMYQPKTVSGEKYLPNTLEAIQQSGLEALPMMPELNALNSLQNIKALKGAPSTFRPTEIPYVAPVAKGVKDVTEATKNIVAPVAAQTGDTLSTLLNSIKPFSVEEAGKTLVKSALKPSKYQHLSGDAEVAVNTLMKNNLPVNQESVDIIAHKITDLNTQVSEAIKGSSGNISKSKVLEGLDNLRKKTALQPAPEADLAAIDAVREQFLKHNVTYSHLPDVLPVELAQKIKEGAYAANKNAYKKFSTNAAGVQAEKAIARGIREQLEQHPDFNTVNNGVDIGALNKEQSKLITTQQVLKPRVAVSGHRDIGGISLIAPDSARMALSMIDRNPYLKSLLGIYLKKMSNIPSTALSGTGGLLTSAANIAAMNPTKAGLAGLLLNNIPQQ